METIREKNVYTFVTETGKKVVFNLDNGDVIGASGKSVKGLPVSVNGSYMARVLYDTCKNHDSIYTRHREIFDRLFSLPKGTFENRDRAIQFLLFTETEIAINNWKIIIDYVENSEKYNPFLGYGANINDLIRIKKTADLIAKYNMEELSTIIYKTGCGIYLTDKVFRKALKEAAKNKYEKFQNAIYELAGTTDKEYIYKHFGVRMSTYDVYYHISEICRKYRVIKETLSFLDMEDYEIRNINEDCVYLTSLYDRKKTEIENNRFCTNQTKNNLYYENDFYKIFVPINREELKEIGDFFHNCANGHEWIHFLQNGRRNLVVVVDKKDDKMVVCCDMDAENLKICQYLAKCNEGVKKGSLLNFKEEYQSYLNTIKGE